jgi:hypothetical protein
VNTARARRRLRSLAAVVPAGCTLGALTVLAFGTCTAAGGAATPAPALADVVIPALGPGYAVTSQGPLDSAQFASNAPDPSAAAGALSTLATSISTYERVWQADGGRNQVQDLLVRFPDGTGAQVFLQAAQHALESGEIVSSDAMPSIPGARRVTYFAATNEDGVGEAVTMRAGEYVDLLSFFSAAAGNAQPISPANAEVVAKAQHVAMVRAPGGAPAPGADGTTTRKGVTAGTIVVAVLAVAVLALAVATPALLRRRRSAHDTVAAPVGMPAGGDAVDGRREQGG